MADGAWFVGQGGQQRGPLTEEDLKGMVARGEVARTDVAWKEGMAEWKPVSELPEFADALQNVPPTLPPSVAPIAPSGPNPFGLMMKDIGGIFKDPEAGIAAATDRKPPILAIILIGVHCLLAGLLAIQSASAFAPRGMGGGDIGEALGRAFRGLVGPSYAEVFFKTFLMAAVYFGIAFGALMIVLAAILQRPDHWAKALSILGLSCLPLVGCGVVAFIFGWLHPWFLTLLAAAEPASVIIFYFAFVHASQAGHRYALYAVPIIYFGLMLVNSGLMRMF